MSGAQSGTATSEREVAANADASRRVRKPRAGETITLTDGSFFVDGQACSSLVLDDAGDAEWRERQHLSLDSYKVFHEALEMDPTERDVYRMFGAYINSAAFRTGKERPLVLDVGCGIFPKPSPAIEQVDARCQYVGLDPLPRNLERAYPYVCGRLEDLAALPGFAPRFDVFVFGTSLDHLESLESAAAAVRKLAAPGALLVCWNGLQEPDKVVTGNGVAVFKKLVGYESRVAAMAAFAGYGVLRLPRLLGRMKVRRAEIRDERVTDHHYRWFTAANSERYLSTFGEVLDVITLPNTDHGFATVRIR